MVGTWLSTMKGNACPDLISQHLRSEGKRRAKQRFESFKTLERPQRHHHSLQQQRAVAGFFSAFGPGWSHSPTIFIQGCINFLMFCCWCSHQGTILNKNVSQSGWRTKFGRWFAKIVFHDSEQALQQATLHSNNEVLQSSLVFLAKSRGWAGQGPQWATMQLWLGVGVRLLAFVRKMWDGSLPQGWKSSWAFEAAPSGKEACACWRCRIRNRRFVFSFLLNWDHAVKKSLPRSWKYELLRQWLKRVL